MSVNMLSVERRPQSFLGCATRPAHKPFSRFGSKQVTGRRQNAQQCRVLEIDWSDAGTWQGVAGAVLGVTIGIGAPVFYSSRDEKDKEVLEEIRTMNRKRFEETGEYMTEEEINKIRVPRWTDNREFADDD